MHSRCIANSTSQAQLTTFRHRRVVSFLFGVQSFQVSVVAINFTDLIGDVEKYFFCGLPISQRG